MRRRSARIRLPRIRFVQSDRPDPGLMDDPPDWEREEKTLAPPEPRDD